jgi:hypothetical protein
LFSGSSDNFLPPKYIYDPVSTRDSQGRLIGGSWYYEKSIRNVYDALERDFDL